MSKRTTPPAVVEADFQIAVDTREQRPWEFRNVTAGAEHGYAPMTVETISTSLDSGDYSIIGREHEIRIERKSPADLFQTLTHGRDRFERELERLNAFPFACVIVEGEFRDLVTNPPSKMLPRSFVGSLVALTTRYRSMWYFAGDRRFAELLAFRILDRWHRDRVAESKPKRQRRASA